MEQVLKNIPCTGANALDAVRSNRYSDSAR
jgi:hypothetical protein